MRKNIVHAFRETVVRGDHQEMINLLKKYEQTGELAVNERGWVYWNISDGYALLREPELLYANHLAFYEWGKETLLPEQYHWVVSDSTQALSLSLGNYFEHWIVWYRYACDHAPKLDSNRAVRFESHRALGGTFWALERYSEMPEVLEHMKQLTWEDQQWDNLLFARITYNKQRLAYLYHSRDEREVDLLMHETMHLIDNIDWASLEPMKKEEVVGSWEDVNSCRNSQRDIHIALNNLACILADIEQSEESAKLFRQLQDRGYVLNGYAFSKYIYSVWKSEGASIARTALAANKSFELSELTKHSPVLVEIGDQI
ncbi:hypothetical protein ABIE27_003414 [Paenibacillus sp. 4624]|jgi:hypothetical protein|uniref:Uncharacterized protein n=1 Tax=Paenibacillus amylolyticus TaxID=1451 RepID=A0A5M9WZJ1_PAEAM|nr:hypothetical protein [Paenibacillus amylolyticus]KAA8787066.1 hypothetical protein EC604_24855 [Paenibacillus amylolyticus]